MTNILMKFDLMSDTSSSESFIYKIWEYEIPAKAFVNDWSFYS